MHRHTQGSACVMQDHSMWLRAAPQNPITDTHKHTQHAVGVRA